MSSPQVVEVVHISEGVMLAGRVVVERCLWILVKVESLQRADHTASRVVELHTRVFNTNGRESIHDLPVSAIMSQTTNNKEEYADWSPLSILGFRV